MVVMGHHHHPDHHELDDGRAYLNTGAWVNTGIDKNHAHAVVVHSPDGELEASLHRGRQYLGASS